MVSIKATYSLAGAVAFLVFLFPTGLYNADYCYDDTDNCNNNTNSANHCFYHLMYLSSNFPSVSPPIILEVLKMYSFWRKANRLPFWQHLCLLYSIRECFPMNFCGMGSQNLRYRNWLFLQNRFLYIFTKGQITDIFRLFRAKKVPPEIRRNLFYVSFCTTNFCQNWSVVKITVTETVHPGWTG